MVMVTKVTWVLDSIGKPNLKIEFSSSVEKDKFFKDVQLETQKLGLNFPLIKNDHDSLLIGASKYPANPCGCYISPGGKLAINFGKTSLRDFLLAKMNVKAEHAEIPGVHNTIFFHPTKLPKVNSSIQLAEEAPQEIIAHSPSTFFNSSKNVAQSINEVKLSAVGSVNNVKVHIAFKNQQERLLFLSKVITQLKTSGVDLPFELQEPNKVVILSSNYPIQKLGCYISKNKEVAINFGSNELRDFILSQLSINADMGIQPSKGEIGSDVFYFDLQNLSLNGPQLSVGKKEVVEADYLKSTNGSKAINYVFNAFLSKAYNIKLSEPESQDIKTAWEKHYDWEHWYNMSQDWSLQTPVGEVQRPNHGIAHTLRVAQLVPIIAEFLKEYGDPKFKKLSQNDIQKAQFMMLFSVIGRENDMSWTDASHYQQAYFEAKGTHSEHLYSKFKKNAEKGFLEHVTTNKADLIPSLFSSEQELKYWAQALDTGKPGITSASGILMAMAHDLDLMRCYDKSKFKNIKMNDFVAKLGGNKEAAQKLAGYAHDLIIATGDRCMGYAQGQTYQKKLFGQCSLDPKACLQQIQSVPVPEATAKATYGL